MMFGPDWLALTAACIAAELIQDIVSKAVWLVDNACKVIFYVIYGL